MNEREIQLALYHSISSGAKVVCPNFTPKRWWECDLFVISAAGYFTEYEIKLTVADFRADAKKAMRGMKKHDLLALKSEHGPTRFFYVVPHGLIQETEVPDWAGLAYYKSLESGNSYIVVKKRAPRLHRIRFPELETQRCLRNMYYRLWGEIQKRVSEWKDKSIGEALIESGGS